MLSQHELRDPGAGSVWPRGSPASGGNPQAAPPGSQPLVLAQAPQTDPCAHHRNACASSSSASVKGGLLARSLPAIRPVPQGLLRPLPSGLSPQGPALSGAPSGPSSGRGPPSAAAGRGGGGGSVTRPALRAIPMAHGTQGQRKAAGEESAGVTAGCAPSGLERERETKADPLRAPARRPPCLRREGRPVEGCDSMGSSRHRPRPAVGPGAEQPTRGPWVPSRPQGSGTPTAEPAGASPEACVAPGQPRRPAAVSFSKWNSLGSCGKMAVLQPRRGLGPLAASVPTSSL